MKIKNNQGQLVTVPKQHEKTVKAMIAKGQHDKVSDLVNSFSNQQPSSEPVMQNGGNTMKKSMLKKKSSGGKDVYDKPSGGGGSDAYTPKAKTHRPRLSRRAQQAQSANASSAAPASTGLGGKSLADDTSKEKEMSPAEIQVASQGMAQGKDQESFGGGKYEKGGKHWIQGAINPAHKGYCTPMTKKTCTGHRRALAEMFKNKHGFHKKEYGGQPDFTYGTEPVIEQSANGENFMAVQKPRSRFMMNDGGMASAGVVNNAQVVAMYGKSCKENGGIELKTRTSPYKFTAEFGGMLPKADVGSMDGNDDWYNQAQNNHLSNFNQPANLSDPNQQQNTSATQQTRGVYQPSQGQQRAGIYQQPINGQNPNSYNATQINDAQTPSSNPNDITLTTRGIGSIQSRNYGIPAAPGQSTVNEGNIYPDLNKQDNTSYNMRPKQMTEDNTAAPGNPMNQPGNPMNQKQYNKYKNNQFGNFISAGSGAGYKTYLGSSMISSALNTKGLSSGQKGMGIASGIAGVASGAFDMVGDALLGAGQGKHDSRVLNDWRQRQIRDSDTNENPATNTQSMYSTNGQNSNQAYHERGGLDIAEYGTIKANPNGATIEAQGGEWAKTKQGQIKKFVGDPHGSDADGDGHEGIPTREADEIITDSPKLPIGADVSRAVMAQFGLKVKASSTYSDIMDAFDRKNKVKENNEVVDNPKSDKIALKTAQMNLAKIEQPQQELHTFVFGGQETKKMLGHYDKVDPNISRETYEQHMSTNSSNPLAQHLKANMPKALFGWMGAFDERLAKAGNGATSTSPIVSGPPDAANQNLQYPDQNAIYKAASEHGYDGENNMDAMQKWAIQNHGDDVNAYLQTVPITDKGMDKYGKNYNGVRDLNRNDANALTREERFDEFNDQKYQFRWPNMDKWGQSKPTPTNPVTPTTPAAETTQASKTTGNYNYQANGPKGYYDLGPGSTYLPEMVGMGQLGRRPVLYNEDRGATNALNAGTSYQRAPIFTQDRNDVWSAFRTKMGTNKGDASLVNTRNNADYETAYNELNKINQQQENSQRQTYNKSNEDRTKLLLDQGRNKQAAMETYETRSNKTEANLDEARLRIADKFAGDDAGVWNDNWKYKLRQSEGPDISGAPGNGLYTDPSTGIQFKYSPTSLVAQQQTRLNGDKQTTEWKRDKSGKYYKTTKNISTEETPTGE